MPSKTHEMDATSWDQQKVVCPSALVLRPKTGATMRFITSQKEHSHPTTSTSDNKQTHGRTHGLTHGRTHARAKHAQGHIHKTTPHQLCQKIFSDHICTAVSSSVDRRESVASSLKAVLC
jgi:hypothetical protein